MSQTLFVQNSLIKPTPMPHLFILHIPLHLSARALPLYPGRHRTVLPSSWQKDQPCRTPRLRRSIPRVLRLDSLVSSQQQAGLPVWIERALYNWGQLSELCTAESRFDFTNQLPMPKIEFLYPLLPASSTNNYQNFNRPPSLCPKGKLQHFLPVSSFEISFAVLWTTSWSTNAINSHTHEYQFNVM